MRKLFLTLTPPAVAAVLLFHPTGTGEVSDVIAANADRWVAVHVAMAFGIGLMAAWLWTLLRGQTSRAATVSRVALVPFVVLYGAFEAVAGIASGVLAQNGQLAAVETLWDNWITGDPGLLAAGGLAWAVAMIAAAVALRGAGATRLTTGLLAAGALFFMHAPPVGPTALVLLTAGTVLALRGPRLNAWPTDASPLPRPAPSTSGTCGPRCWPGCSPGRRARGSSSASRTSTTGRSRPQLRARAARRPRRPRASTGTARSCASPSAAHLYDEAIARLDADGLLVPVLLHARRDPRGGQRAARAAARGRLPRHLPRA